MQTRRSKEVAAKRPPHRSSKERFSSPVSRRCSGTSTCCVMLISSSAALNYAATCVRYRAGLGMKFLQDCRQAWQLPEDYSLMPRCHVDTCLNHGTWG